MARVAELKYNLSFSVTGTEQAQKASDLASSLVENQRLINEESRKAGSQTRAQSAAIKDANESLDSFIRSLERLRQKQLKQGDIKGYTSTTRAISDLTRSQRVATGVTDKYNSSIVAQAKREERRAEAIRKAIADSNVLISQSKITSDTFSKQNVMTARSATEYDKLTKKYENQVSVLKQLSSTIGVTADQKSQLNNKVRALTSEQQRLNLSYDKTGNRFSNIISQIRSATTGIDFLTANFRKNEISSEEARVELDMFNESISSIQESFDVLSKYTEFSSEQVNKFRSEMTKAINSSVVADRNIRGLGTAFSGTTKATNSANQLLLSFGDIAQDSAQFSYGFASGMRAIGNNITFAAEQYSILSQKASQATGQQESFGQTMVFLGRSLKGPGGIIILLSLAVTAMTMFSERQRKLKKDAEDSKKAIDSLTESIQAFIFEYSRLRISQSYDPLDQRSLQGQLDAVNNLIDASPKLKNLVNDLDSWKASLEEGVITEKFVRDMKVFGRAIDVYASSAIRTFTEEYSNSVDEVDSRTKALLKLPITVLRSLTMAEFELRSFFRLDVFRKQDIKRVEEYAKAIGLTEEQYRGLIAKAKDLNDEIAMTNALIALDPIQSFLKSQGESVQKYITDFEMGVEGSRSALLSIYETNKELISAYKELYRQGNEDAAAYVRGLENNAEKLEAILFPDQKEEKADKISYFMSPDELGKEERERLFAARMSAKQLELLRAERITNDEERARKTAEIELDILRMQLREHRIELGEFLLEKERIENKYNDTIKDLNLERRMSERDLQIAMLEELPVTQQVLDQIKSIREADLKDRINVEILSEYEIAAEKFRIQKEYEDGIKQMRLANMNEYAAANKQLNQELANSVSTMFSALIPSRKRGALLMLAMEKALAIGGVIAESQEKINSLRTEQARLAGLGAVFTITGNPMAGQYISAAGSLEGSIAAIKASRAKSIAKIAAIGLAQGIAGAAGDDSPTGAGGSAAAAAAPAFGFQQNMIEGPQTFRTPGYIPSNTGANVQVNVTNELKASRRDLYILTKQGEEEYREAMA